MANPLNIKKYAVTGSPVLFSKSPAIYNYLFEQHGLKSHFSRLAADSPAEVSSLIKQTGLDGISVTAPFKQSMLPYLDVIDTAAKEINAVNAIVNVNGRLAGYNTDVIGIADSLRRYGFNPQGRRCLIIGAGGAAFAAVYAMKQAGGKIAITNRSTDKGNEIAGRFAVEFIDPERIAKTANDYDLIINTIPSSAALLNNIELHSGITLLDANYFDDNLKAKAKESGGQYIPGIDWLIGQAIPAFELFTGLKHNRDEATYHTLYNMLFDQLKASDNINKPIALIGFTGSGKSTSGKKLAQKLNYEFTDLDLLIEQMAGKPITEIFRDEQEQGFRSIENRALLSVVHRENIVIACGGGIVGSKENIELLKQHFNTIWLFAPPEICIGRIDTESKPMLSSSAENHNPARLYQSRHDKYFLASDLIVNAERPAGSVVQKIYEEYNHQ